MEEYSDESLMPFGKHKGKALEDVPAKYLMWLYGELHGRAKLNEEERKLWNYIMENFEVIEHQISEDEKLC